MSHMRGSQGMSDAQFRRSLGIRVAENVER